LKYKSRLIYLISPNKLYDNFLIDLRSILATKKVKYFQLRLKKYKKGKILNISKKIKKICRNFNVKFIINDDPIIAKKVDADGCHLGQGDMSINNARRILKNKIIGVTCNNSIIKAREAVKNKADYIALGAFNSSKTKKVKFKAKISDLKKFRKITNKPIVVIGGIGKNNYKKLLLNKADFLAISNFIWKNKKLKPAEATKSII
tara:strand:- start:106 stop:717 length:612 start_codon:yes stop_codon:yes gene_type:complete